MLFDDTTIVWKNLIKRNYNTYRTGLYNIVKDMFLPTQF